MTVLIFCVGSSQPSVTLPRCSEPPSSSAEVTPGPLFVETQILLLRKRLALGICFKCHLKVSPVVGFFSKIQRWLPVFQVCSPLALRSSCLEPSVALDVHFEEC